MMETKKMTLQGRPPKEQPPKGMGKKQGKKNHAWLRSALLLALVAVCSFMIWQNGRKETQEPYPLASVAPNVTTTQTPAPQSSHSIREIAYDKDIQTLTALTQNNQIDSETRAQAAQRLSQMVADHQSEIGIEDALFEAGYQPCMVLLQNGSLTVMVTKDTLADTETVTILSICAAHTDIGIENIRIMTGQSIVGS